MLTKPDLHIRIKRAVARDLKESRLSRAEIVDQLSLACRQRITVANLDAMVAETKPHRFPAAWIPAWVRITGSHRLLELLCEESGYWLADEVEHDLAEMSRAEIERDRADSRATQLRERLEGKV